MIKAYYNESKRGLYILENGEIKEVFYLGHATKDVIYKDIYEFSKIFGFKTCKTINSLCDIKELN